MPETVFVIGYRRGLLALASVIWNLRVIYLVTTITCFKYQLKGVKVGLSSQYKIRKAKRENKVLASKLNLNNESEEGTKITV